MGCVADPLVNGDRLRALTIVDVPSREALSMKKSSVATLAVLTALLLIGWSYDLSSTFSDPSAIQARIAEAGLWGPLVFLCLAVGMFALLMMAPVVWAATAVWPLPLAFSYSFAAALLASVFTYAAARRLDQGWQRDRIPISIQRWEDRLRAHPVSTLLALRLVLGANPLVDLFAGAAQVTARAYLLSTVVGLLVSTAFHVVLGVGGIVVGAHLLSGAGR